ncbi:acetyl-CoA carboxylase biotin carboxyl carrier protein subunit [Thermosulfuriphilus sp.]
MAEIKAPVTATVVELRAWPGKLVEAGEELAQLEAMKVYIPIQAPCRGRIERVWVKSGEVVEKDAPLMTIVCMQVD